jgi:hypothetical protein
MACLRCQAAARFLPLIATRSGVALHRPGRRGVARAHPLPDEAQGGRWRHPPWVSRASAVRRRRTRSERGRGCPTEAFARRPWTASTDATSPLCPPLAGQRPRAGPDSPLPPHLRDVLFLNGWNAVQMQCTCSTRTSRSRPSSTRSSQVRDRPVTRDGRNAPKPAFPAGRWRRGISPPNGRLSPAQPSASETS